MPTRRRKISLLGSFSLIAGIIALFATRLYLGGVGPVTIGVIGAVIGFLGLLSAVVIGGAGRVLPLFAMLLCLGAAGYGLWANGRDDGVGARVTAWISQWHTSGSQPATSSGHSTSGPGAASPPPHSGAGSAGTDDRSIGHHSIFDMNAPGTPESTSHGNASPGKSTAGNTTNAPSLARPSGPDPTLLASLRTHRADAQTAVQAAKVKLDAAKKALTASLANQPAYQAAKADLDAAEVNLSAVRASSDPGSESLLAASTRVLNARIALEKIVAAASASDPATSAAQRQFAEAQHKLVSIKAEQDTAAGKKQ